MPNANPPTLPWYKSPVFLGSAAALASGVLATIQAYQPGVSIAQQWNTLTAPMVSAIGGLVASWTRITATAQPLTLTDKNG